jgi:hypothetical protein
MTEGLIGRFRNECLNEEVFVGLAEARAVIRALAVRLEPGATGLGPPWPDTGPRATGCTNPDQLRRSPATIEQPV